MDIKFFISIEGRTRGDRIRNKIFKSGIHNSLELEEK
jgi:hypothetical protein